MSQHDKKDTQHSTDKDPSSNPSNPNTKPAVKEEDHKTGTDKPAMKTDDQKTGNDNSKR